MIALQLLEVKPFMNKLLASDMFHNFLLSEAVIVNGVTYTIDGHVTSQTDANQKDLFPYKLITFDKVQRSLFEMIKGSHTPSYMKYVFCLTPENVSNTLSSIGSALTSNDISGMYINLVFQDNHLLCTTGISYNIFVKDHALEQEWDRLVKLFLTKHSIFYETLS